ncbi:MAG: hypothetical protein P8174_09390, partial [Gemmatimonadota bacterium]
DPQQFGAGQYVHVNEGTDAFGFLPNFAAREIKVSVWGMTLWNVRGGLFFTFSSGDHYSPQFRISSMGLYQFVESPWALPYHAAGPVISGGTPVDWRLLSGVEGDYVFVGPRGLPEFEKHANWDIRLERPFRMGGMDLSVSLDVFNVFGSRHVTRYNTMVNNGQNYWSFLGPDPQALPWQRVPADQYFRANLERVPPRTFRLGIETRW